MWIVTVAAVLGDRRMFPKIRAAFLGMAIKAGLVKRLLGKLPLARLAMGAVAAAAIHLALPNRVSIGLQCLRTLLLVAIEAHFRLRRGHQDRVRRSVTRMAVGA